MQNKYTNSILTIIAGCLIFQVVQSLMQKPIPITVKTEETEKPPTGTLDVRIVGVSDPLKVNLVSLGGDTLSRVGSQVVLPVGVHNTVEVDVKGIGGDTLSRVGGQVVLPVGVHNTVEVDVLAVDGALAGPSYKSGLPVYIMSP